MVKIAVSFVFAALLAAPALAAPIVASSSQYEREFEDNDLELREPIVGKVIGLGALALLVGHLWNKHNQNKQNQQPPAAGGADSAPPPEARDLASIVSMVTSHPAAAQLTGLLGNNAQLTSLLGNKGSKLQTRELADLEARDPFVQKALLMLGGLIAGAKLSNAIDNHKDQSTTTPSAPSVSARELFEELDKRAFDPVSYSNAYRRELDFENVLEREFHQDLLD